MLQAAVWTVVPSARVAIGYGWIPLNSFMLRLSMLMPMFDSIRTMGIISLVKIPVKWLNRLVCIKTVLPTARPRNMNGRLINSTVRVHKV